MLLRLKNSAPEYNPKIDHCSSSPEGIAGCNYSRACYWHDMQYRDLTVNRQSRLHADLALWGNIVKEAWKVRKTSILWSWVIGSWYFIVVRIKGGKYYK